MATIDSIEQCPPLPVVQGIEFRHCSNFIGYVVGSDGSLWSCVPNHGQLTTTEWRKLNPCLNSKKRRCQKMAGGSAVNIATLVCIAFHGDRPAGMEVCHRDGIRTHDWASNLKWGTHLENMQDAVKDRAWHQNGRIWPKGERCPAAKLSDYETKIIRELGDYITGKEIASMYGVSRATVSMILNNKIRKSS